MNATYDMVLDHPVKERWEGFGRMLRDELLEK